MDERIVIIGGGVIGSSTAYHLARAGHADRVTVVEPDPTYELAASPKAVGAVRVQFSIPENIEMSLHGHAVFARFADDMAIDGEPADIAYERSGFLILGAPRDAALLQSNERIQTGLGAQVELLDAAGVKARFPSLEVGDVAVAAHSPADAVIDPYRTLMAYRKKAIALGVRFLEDRVTDLDTRDNLVRSARLASGPRLEGAWFVNAANCWAPDICAMVGMRIPVAPMRRMVFYFECREPVERMGVTRHASEPTSFRSFGAGFTTGITRHDEPRGFNHDVEWGLFDEAIWPALAARVPAFEAIKVKSAYSGHYDQNSLDANLIIGAWPGRLENFLLACGLSGHGLQHAPAIGRALSELIVDREFRTIDLSRFGCARIAAGEPLAERGAIS